MEKPLERCWCLLPIPQGSDFLTESWSTALWREPPHTPVGNCEGVGKAARLRGNVPANQLSMVATDGGQKAVTLAQCYTVLHSANKWGPTSRTLLTSPQPSFMVEPLFPLS